jgi:HEAT repeat protein
MSSRLAQYFVAQGLVAAPAVDEALKLQATQGGGLDTALLQLGMPEEMLLEALSQVSGLPSIDLTGFEPNPEVARLIPPKLAERLKVVPLSLEGNTLHVACAEPVPQAELNEVGFLLGKELALWVAPELRLRDWMVALFGVRLSEREQRVLSTLKPGHAHASGTPPVQVPTPVSAKVGPSDDTLSLDYVEQLAQSVSEEPILLDRPRSEEAPIAAPEQPAWTLADAKDALNKAAYDREAIKDVALQYAMQTFEYAAAFAVIRGTAVGWDARGPGADPASVGQVSFPLDTPSIFRTVALARSSFVGPVPNDAMTQMILQSLGRQSRAAFVAPVEVRGRLVGMLYADSGSRPLSQRGAADFGFFCQELSAAFQELILSRKQRKQDAHPEPEPEPVAQFGYGWAPSTPSGGAGVGRLAAMPPQVRAEQPPSDFGPILRRLTGPDPTMRARAMAELARSPEASARVLVRDFPGPTAWSRMPVSDLPEPDELGPIPGALSRLGRPAASALAPLLDADEPDTRYFALLTSGGLPFPELVPGVLRGLFDLEPEIASAARASARKLRRLSRFESSMRGLRQELTALDPLRRSLAARALGALHDRDSVDGLIGLTASEDSLLAQAAVEALQEITRANFGTNPRAWSAWWAENRDRRRSEWLVAALSHRELELRHAALEELATVVGDSLGYEAEAPGHVRASGIERWMRALSNDARLRQLD